MPISPDHYGRYRASDQLAAFVLWRGCQVPHRPTPDAPGTPRELAAWAAVNEIGVNTLPVYDGGSEKTIYPNDAVNFAFRAWHDSLHIAELQAGRRISFELPAELAIAAKHVEEARAAGLSGHDLSALWYDTAGQAWHWAIHHAYVDDQAGFVLACFEQGIHGACVRNWAAPEHCKHCGTDLATIPPSLRHDCYSAAGGFIACRNVPKGLRGASSL